MEKIDVTVDELRLSVSKKKVFVDCKKKYKFQYIEKKPRKDWDHFTFGSFSHKVLEDFHQYYIDQQDWRAEKTPRHEIMTKSFKNAIKEFKPKLTKEMISEAYNYMCLYLTTLEQEFPHVLSCEEEFNLSLGNNIKLLGFIDRVQVDDDGVLHVCDYKSSKSDKYLKNDPFQLLTYAFIMLKKDPTLETVRGSYIMIKDSFKYITFDFSKEEILSIEENFLNCAVDIRTETEYEASPTSLCNWCDFMDFCPEGKSKSFNKPVFGAIAW